MCLEHWVHFGNYTVEFKNNPSARLYYEQGSRPDGTVQTEVTMGDITESRPVNVSFSFFYINSLPISNWNMTPLPPLSI